MEENGWSRPSSRLWTLFEWSFIGAGLIFTLIGLSVNGLLNLFGPLADGPRRRREITNKRILIVNGNESKLGQAIVHRLQNDHNCNVISFSRGHRDRPQPQRPVAEMGTRQDNDTIICDLTNNQECRTQIQRIWQEDAGIDLVINCEMEDLESSDQNHTVGQRVERIGSNIQQMINLLINVVPKMIDHGTSGKFALVRNCRPPRRQLQDENAFGVVATGEYDDLLEQLLISASTNNGSREAERPNIDLIQLYCHGGRVEEVAASVVNAIESGKRGTVDISQSDLWTFLIRKLTWKRSPTDHHRRERAMDLSHKRNRNN